MRKLSQLPWPVQQNASNRLKQNAKPSNKTNVADFPMTLLPEQQEIAQALGYEPLEGTDLTDQFDALVDFFEALGQVPHNGSVRRHEDRLQLFWIPSNPADIDDLSDWYDIPSNEEFEEWVFDSLCPTPAEDDVEPDHPDSWMSLLGMI